MLREHRSTVFEENLFCPKKTKTESDRISKDSKAQKQTGTGLSTDSYPETQVLLLHSTISASNIKKNVMLSITK